MPSQISIRVTSPVGDAATLEDFAQALRIELIDAGAQRVDQASAGRAPDGARSLELIGLLSFIITATDAGESIAKIIRAIRAVAKRYADARRPVTVTVGESDVDLAGADDEQLASVVARIARTASTGVRAALIVANAAYDHAGLTELRAPGADATALAGVLRDPTIGAFDVELLTDADERTVRRRLAAFFAHRERDDVLLLHFSCHGVKDFRGRLYFAAKDTDLHALGATAVPASFVNDLLDETQAGRVVLILDCCYSGAFARGAATRADDAVHVNEEFRSGTGRIVLTASSATEYAFEGTTLTRDAGQPSVFTGALVEGLATGAADIDADGEITIDELYDYTYQAVRRATPGQAPMKWTFGVEGAVVIARSNRRPTLPRAIVDDLASDRGVLREEGVRALGALLATGSPGMRLAASEALARLMDNDDSLRVRQAAALALTSAGLPAGSPTHAAASSPAVASSPAPAPVSGAPSLATAPASGAPRPIPTQPGPAIARPAKRPPNGRSGSPTAAGAIPDRSGAAGAPGWLTSSYRQLLGIAAGVAALLATVAYFIGIASLDPDDMWQQPDTTNVIYSILGIAAIVALVSRRRGALAVLTGLLTWHPPLTVILGVSSVYDSMHAAGPAVKIGTIFGLAATAFAVIAVFPALDTGVGATGRRTAVALLITPLTIVTAILASDLAMELLKGYQTEQGGWRILLAVLGVLVVPLAGLLAPRDMVNRWLIGGWVLGGLIYAAAAASDPDVTGGWAIGPWALVLSTAAAAAVIYRVFHFPPAPAGPNSANR